MTTWNKVTRAISGTIVDMILDPFYPKHRAWVMTSDSIYKTTNLNDSVPTWTRIVQATDFFSSALGPEFVRVRNTAAKKNVYYILMYAKSLSTDIERRQYVIRSDDNGSTFTTPTWTGLTDAGATSGDTLFDAIVNNPIAFRTDTYDSVVGTADAAYACGRDGTATGTLAIVKRDIETGQIVWTQYDQDLNPIDNAQAKSTRITADNTLLYLAGYSRDHGITRYRVQARNQSDGSIVWNIPIVPGNSDNYPTGICQNLTGVYSCGFIRITSPAARGWYIERRDKTTGAQGWTQSYTRAITTDFLPYSIACDENFVYIAGSDYDAINGRLFWRIEKRSVVDGSLAWSQSIQNSISVDDKAHGICVYNDALFVLGENNSASIGNRVLVKKLLVSTGAGYGGSWTDYTVIPTPTATNTFLLTEGSDGIAADSSGVYLTVVDASGGSPSQRWWQVTKLDLSTGAVIWRKTPTKDSANPLNYPYDISVGPSGILYIGGGENNLDQEARLVALQGSVGTLDTKRCLSVGQHDYLVVYTANKTTVVKSSNGSSSFSNLITTVGANDIECFIDGNADDSSIYFWGTDGSLYRYTTLNGVVSLALTESAKNRHLRLRSFITDHNIIYTFKHTGSDTWSLMKSTNGGISWTTQVSGLSGIRSLVVWAFSSARVLFLSSLAIYYSADSGITLQDKTGNWATVMSAFASPVVIGAVWLG